MKKRAAFVASIITLAMTIISPAWSGEVPKCSDPVIIRSMKNLIRDKMYEKMVFMYEFSLNDKSGKEKDKRVAPPTAEDGYKYLWNGMIGNLQGYIGLIGQGQQNPLSYSTRASDSEKAYFREMVNEYPIEFSGFRPVRVSPETRFCQCMATMQAGEHRRELSYAVQITEDGEKYFDVYDFQ